MVVVTDIPVKVAEIEGIVRSIDKPVEQVSIEAMVVDALLSDGADTGVDWFLSSSNTDSFRNLDEPADSDNAITELSKFAASTALAGPASGGLLSWTLVDGNLGFGASISALIESKDADLLANPTIVTVENKPAVIDITTEFPYQERTQTDRGGQLASTKFKSVGTVLEVTPQVTVDKQIIAAIKAKESSVVGFTSDEIPIESKRTASTTLRLNDGQTVMIGGLRRTTDTITERKVPVLGDIPLLNVFFKSQNTDQSNSELLIFLTCNVLPSPGPELTPYEKEKFDQLGGKPMKPNGSKQVVDSYLSPDQMRDPIYKWRRTK
jgi:type II secretory pathway component GspD/PulD (secretin)